MRRLDGTPASGLLKAVAAAPGTGIAANCGVPVHTERPRPKGGDIVKLPIEITYHRIRSSEWIEAEIRARAAKLDTYYRDIMGCRVTVDRPHGHHEAGNRFRLTIDLTVKGGEIAVTREATLHAMQKARGDEQNTKAFEVEGMRKDLKLVIRQAFDVARRRLQDYARRQRGDVKTRVTA